MHAPDEARCVIVILVSLLWVKGSIICPEPLLVGQVAEGHGEPHGVEMPGEEHHHAGTSCEIPGNLNVVTARPLSVFSNDY